MEVTQVTITPKVAAEMLEKNTCNRQISKSHVANLAREISEGRWKANGDTIVMNGERLIDGQHRLLAIIEASVPVRTLLVTGVASDVFDTKDVGKRRLPGDALTVVGEKDVNNMAAAVGVLIRYEAGTIFPSKTSGSYVSNSEIVEGIAKYPGLRESLAAMYPLSIGRWMSTSMAAACHYLFSQVDPVAATEFFSLLANGENLTRGNPVYQLRERLYEFRVKRGTNPSRWLVMALVIKAWNLHRSGATIKSLSFRIGKARSGEGAEKFPVIKSENPSA